MPRKSGKSTLAAGIALYLLFADGEPGAEVYSAAADREQAAIVFNTAREMVLASPALSRRARVYRRVIEVPRMNAVYRVLSADVPTKHGLNPHGVIFDELHAQPTRELWDVLTTASGARAQPVTFAMSTAGLDEESDPICAEVWRYSRQVRDGIIHDPSWLPVIYEAPLEAPWDSEETWRQWHPGLGHTISLEYLREQARQAEASPARQAAFRRLYLNQWVRAHDAWLDLAAWDACGEVGPPPEEDWAGRACHVGLDLASTTDITAACLVFPRQDGGVDALWRLWVPEARLRGHRYAAQYAAWAQDGWLRTTPGAVVDYEAVLAQIDQDARRYRIQSVGLDALFQGASVWAALERMGLQVWAHPQTAAAYTGAMRLLHSMVLSQRLHHYRHPVLRWMVDNVVAVQDAAGRIRPDKRRSRGAIDGVVALLMALDRLQRAEAATGGPNVWVF